MKRVVKVAVLFGAVGLAVVGLAGVAQAQVGGEDKATPKGWNYEIKDGKRVPKGQRQVNADGSWREEIRQGKCLTIKEKTAAGEYKESRRCD
jgi:hypothetical protein